jgi:Ca2+-binding EF-hand superfamily protein
MPGDTDGDGVITLIDISNIVDMFGVNSEDPLWAEARFFDFNNNNEIDIADIVVIAKQIH